MSRGKQIEEMRHLADEMGKAISNEYEKRVLADERKLEAVLKENGWRKASEVAREIFEEIVKYAWNWIGIEDRFLSEGVNTEFNAGFRQAYMYLIDYLALLKKKYTEGE